MGSNKNVATVDESLFFDQIGPSPPSVDMERIAKARVRIGAHRVVPNEVIELIMPSILYMASAKDEMVLKEVQPLMCRITEQGTIDLPIVGEIEVTGLTLSKIEAKVKKAYHPTYIRNRPTVFARVIEKKTHRVAISGAIAAPGLYDLPTDEMTLVSLLMKAGGIINKGAASIRVLRQSTANSTTGSRNTRTAKDLNVVLPVKGLNIPFSDVTLHEGDSVIVEKLQMPMFSVLGLVKTPGNFEYPPGADYTLMDAIAFASGIDMTLDPRYAVIYRLNQDGEIAHMRVKIQRPSNEENLASAMRIRIKPGDIIMLEHTARTRTREFIASVFSVHIGAYVRPLDD